MAQSKVNLLDLDRRGLKALFIDMGEKAYRATQIMQWIYQFGTADFDAMTNLSKGFRQWLKTNTEIRVPEIITEQCANDGTLKWLLRVDSSNCIETVFIPGDSRGTLCISSQVGCALDCSFCSTAQQGFNRNLSVSEIIGQVWLAYRAMACVPNEERKITNVVFMGMGEPLLNFNNVVTAMDLMMDDYAYCLSKRRVTLSTSGVIPALDRLREVSDVSLAVSLHAPDDELRNILVPLNRKYPIRELLAACRRYVQGESRRKVTFEYVMLDGINDTPAHAYALAKLLRDLPAKINLIPFNLFPATRYRCSPHRVIDEFREILIMAGIVTVTRKTRGNDIDAACGQLAGKVMDRTRRHEPRLNS